MKRIITISTVLAWLLLIPMFTISQQSGSAMITKYYQIKNALVISDAVAAGKASVDLVSFLKAAKNQSADNQTAFKKIISDANLISGTKDLEKQRAAFQSLSEKMITVAKTSKLSQPAFVNYCPMKKVYWLSSENQVKNPYYGNSMLTCGDITDTIK